MVNVTSRVYVHSFSCGQKRRIDKVIKVADLSDCSDGIGLVDLVVVVFGSCGIRRRKKWENDH